MLSSMSHCRTRLLAQQHNTIVFISVPISIGTHSSTVSRTMTTCIPVLSPIHVLCSRCSSLLSFDNKSLASYSSTDFSIYHTSYHYQKYTDYNHITLICSLGLASLSEHSKDVPSQQKDIFAQPGRFL